MDARITGRLLMFSCQPSATLLSRIVGSPVFLAGLRKKFSPQVGSAAMSDESVKKRKNFARVCMDTVVLEIVDFGRES